MMVKLIITKYIKLMYKIFILNRYFYFKRNFFYEIKIRKYRQFVILFRTNIYIILLFNLSNERYCFFNKLRVCLTVILVEVFSSTVFLWKTLLWESEKMILIVFLIICCMIIKILLILINYQKGHTILITKRK